VLGAGMNFQKMGTKNMQSNGVGNDLTVGANLNFNFNETIGLCTGVEFDFSTTKFQPSTATPTYYTFRDTEILQKGDGMPAGSQLFELTSRNQKSVYLTIPTMLLFRTKFIGYFRYFGKFGLRSSFLLSSKSNDTGYAYTSTDINGTSTSGTNEGMTASGDVFFFKSAVGLAGGAEWNFSGSTCLVAELGYYYGITPLYWGRNSDSDKTTLHTSGLENGTGSNFYFANKATQGQLMLKVSILF
jgi:hypothetical protein